MLPHEIRTYHIVDAKYIDHDDSQKDIFGVPGFYEDGFGNYTGAYPHIAASKAYSGLLKFMKKFHNKGPDNDWFSTYNKNDPFDIIFVLQDKETGKAYAFLGKRYTATQSIKGGRTITSPSLRKRTYYWRNHIKALKLKDVVD